MTRASVSVACRLVAGRGATVAEAACRQMDTQWLSGRRAAQSGSGCAGVRGGGVEGLCEAGKSLFFSGIASLGLPSVGKCHLSK